MTDVSYRVGGEGGATHSQFVLLRSDGVVVATHGTGPTNAWVSGFEATARTIVGAVDALVAEAGLTGNVVSLLALCLSGMDFEADQKRLRDAILSERSGIVEGGEAERIVICTDVLGSVHTASEDGGVVVISGTGSAAMHVSQTGEVHRCGGWGHAIGDEGSAYWIARRCLEEVFRSMDGVPGAAFDGLPVEAAWNLAREHFGIAERAELLEHLYASFNKAKIAGLTEKLCALAVEGDKFVLEIVRSAGRELALLVAGLIPRMGPASIRKDADGTETLSISVVGSVWKSFDLFRDTFVSTLAPRKVILSKITGSSAIGAIVYACKSRDEHAAVNHAEFVSVLFDGTS